VYARGIPASHELPAHSRATCLVLTRFSSSRTAKASISRFVGPEAVLNIGVADRFAAGGRLLFGPTTAASRLETSKAFSKAFMARHGIPTARFHTCEALDEAVRVISSGEFGWPLVLKADGLAAGKGVVVAEDRDAPKPRPWPPWAIAGSGRLETGSLSKSACPVPRFRSLSSPMGNAPCRSGRRRTQADLRPRRGPNTGGMGAFAPSPLIDATLGRRIMQEIVEPVIEGMAGEGYPFRGFLYVGLMLTAAGPQVIEFNVRLGDPEAQVILSRIDEPLLRSSSPVRPERFANPRSAPGTICTVGVVLASRGYPESASSGQIISGVDEAEAFRTWRCITRGRHAAKADS